MRDKEESSGFLFHMFTDSTYFVSLRSDGDRQQQSGSVVVSGWPGYAPGCGLPQGHVQCGCAIWEDTLPAAGRENLQAAAAGSG